jgi:hypothetical protein
MKITAFTLLFIWHAFMNIQSDYTKNFYQYSGVDIISISQQLLLAAKTKEPTDSFVNILQRISQQDLSGDLKSDNLKKAFWINLYNAYTQIILSKNPDIYKNRSSFFGSKQILIAGKNLSLDDIEHGILRRSKIKWSLGYFNKAFPSKFEKENRVDKVDYRIHFSLNCGAKSCPPIAFYDPEKIDKQLDVATKTYLKGEAEYNPEKDCVDLPALMNWFRKDFGGKKKMIAILKQLEIVPYNKNPDINFKKYNWDLFLENYKNE